MNKDLTELLTEFDEMGYAPTTLTAEPEKAASGWKKRLVTAIKAENAELKEKAQKLDEQLKAISDRTAKFPSLEQIEKRFLDWAIPFLKARITGCKEEWFGIEWIAKAIWEFIKNGFENAIAVDETNAALRERLEKAIEPPCERDDIFYRFFQYPAEMVEDIACGFRKEKDGELYVCSANSESWYNVKECEFSREAAEARLKELQGGKK